MKFLALFAFVGAASAVSFESLSFMWDSWKIQQNKAYDVAEERLRFAIFADNVAKVEKFNAENDLTKLGINKFADLSADEFKMKHSECAFPERNPEVLKNTMQVETVGNLPDSFDWRSKGAVTAVKNQGQCGSCWSFSTTGLLEGWNFINNKKLTTFSEQQIVDCDKKDGNQGCSGGWPYLAVQYAGKYGLETEADYPYTAEDGKCKYSKAKTTVVNKNYTFITPNSTDALKTAITANPISVLIEADQDVFQLYKSGVIWRNCGNQLDHAVLAVGWQKVVGIDSFIVKNSWGTDWGQSGYVYISTNAKPNGGTGVCGILSQPVTATNK
jgi:C1A family cysteine protease